MPSHTHNNGNYEYLLKVDGKGTEMRVDEDEDQPNIHKAEKMLSQGEDVAHENRPPYYAVNYIIKT